MKQEVNLIRARLKTPRAAAVAGPIFCSPDYGPFIVTAFGPCRSARGGRLAPRSMPTQSLWR